MSVKKIAVDRAVTMLTNMDVPFRIEFDGSMFTNIKPPAVPEKARRTVRYGVFDATNYKTTISSDTPLGKEVSFARATYPELFDDTVQGRHNWWSFASCVKGRAIDKWGKENFAFEGGTVRQPDLTIMRVA